MKKLTLFLILLILALPVGGEAADINVATPVTAATINTAIASASAGDNVIIPDGTYSNLGSINIPSSVDGTEANPIILQPETGGGVTLSGNPGSNIMMNADGDWWTIQNFKFIDVSETGDNNTYGIQINGSNVRVTNNYWEGFGKDNDTLKNNWCVWFAHASSVNGGMVDYNTFTANKAMVIVTKSGNYDATNIIIEYNYFHDPEGYGDSNGIEQLQIGSGDGTEDTDLHNIIRYNLFENCAEDSETISNKSSSNTYYRNVFKSTGGNTAYGLVLRQGDDCLIDSNYFFDVANQNLRVHGAGHKIINNYFENPDYSAILLCEGVGTYPNVSDILILNNTIINPVYRGIHIGWWSGGLVEPANLTFKNNILQSSVPGSDLVKDSGHTGTFVWTTNLHYAIDGASYWENDGGGAEPGSGIAHADPELTQGTYIKILQAGSANAVEQGTVDASVTDDIDGETRDVATPDIGCDEYSATPDDGSVPVTASDVGPTWLNVPNSVIDTPASTVNAVVGDTTVFTAHGVDTQDGNPASGGTHAWDWGNLIVAYNAATGYEDDECCTYDSKTWRSHLGSTNTNNTPAEDANWTRIDNDEAPGNVKWITPSASESVTYTYTDSDSSPDPTPATVSVSVSPSSVLPVGTARRMPTAYITLTCAASGADYTSPVTWEAQWDTQNLAALTTLNGDPGGIGATSFTFTDGTPGEDGKGWETGDTFTLDPGGANEEILTVISRSTNTITTAACTIDHADGEDVAAGIVLDCAAEAFDLGAAGFGLYIAGATTTSSYFHVVQGTDDGDGIPETDGSDTYFHCDGIVVELGEANAGLYDIVISVDDQNDAVYVNSTWLSADHTRIVGCSVINSTNSGAGKYRGVICDIGAGEEAFIIDCLVADIEDRGIWAYDTGTALYVYNTTVDDCGDLVLDVDPSETCISTNVIYNGTLDVDGTATHTVTTCDVSVTDAVWVAPASHDYHLDSTNEEAISDLIGQGTDLSADGNFAFDDDIDGQQIISWPIGYDYVGGAPTVSSIGLCTVSGGTLTDYDTSPTQTYATTGEIFYLGAKYTKQCTAITGGSDSDWSATPMGVGPMKGRFIGHLEDVNGDNAFVSVYEFKVGYSWTGQAFWAEVPAQRVDGIVMQEIANNSATFKDIDGNDADHTGSADTLAGVVIAVPKDANSPFEVKPSGGDATTILGLETAAGYLLSGDYVVAQSSAESYTATVAGVTYRVLSLTDFDADSLAITIYGTNRISGSLTNSGSATLYPYNPPRVTN